MNEKDNNIADDTTAVELTAEQSLALGDAYMVDENCTDAMDTYAAGLLLVRNDDLLTRFRLWSHRSAAFLVLERHAEALEDAQQAAKLLSSTGTPLAGLRAGESEVCFKREGLAALRLGRYAYAQAALESALQLAALNHRETTSVYEKLIQECKDRQQPPKASVAPSKAMNPPAAAAPASAPAPAAASTASNKATMPKYQYYQSDKVMTIAILEPNVRQEDIRVDFEPQHLTVVMTKNHQNFTVITGKLYDEVDVDNSRVQIRADKVLIKLRKSKAFEWHELLSKEQKKKTPPSTSVKDVPTNSKDKPRPYSSHRDWDAIEKQAQAELENEKPEGDEAMNKLFQQIYANADEDTRRAMIKSYQTSGGTVLSTNWGEVAEKDYESERTAPKGVEWKTWEGDKLPTKDDD